MNIKEFLNLRVPEKFDFSNDGAEDEYLKLEKLLLFLNKCGIISRIHMRSFLCIWHLLKHIKEIKTI